MVNISNILGVFSLVTFYLKNEWWYLDGWYFDSFGILQPSLEVPLTIIIIKNKTLILLIVGICVKNIYSINIIWNEIQNYLIYRSLFNI